MKRIICFIIICITSMLLIYKPINKINVVKAEIANLTNTQWELDLAIDLNEDFQYSINFESNNETFTEISIFHNEILYYNETEAFNLSEWNNQAYRIITITGGNDATNTDLINWLLDNATQQTIITYIELTTPTITSGTQGIINWNDVYANYDITMQNGEYEIYYSATQPTQEQDLTIITTTTLRTYHMQQTGYYIIRAYMEEENTIYYSEYSTPYNYQLIPLTTPTLTISNNTLQWQQIQNAHYYNIYKDNELYATTTLNEYTTIENGNYQVQAITNIEGYTNSALSNTIEQNNYNDLIGNGFNFFTMFTAIIDSQVYLIESFLNYEIWGINFYDIFQLLITIALIIIIIKFAIKQKG